MEYRNALGYSVRKSDREKYNLYKTWTRMIDRCFNPNNPHFKNYGGRGIFVCPEWHSSFVNFLNDMGKKPKPMKRNKYRRFSIHRINNDGWYSPENCKWADSAEQGRVRRKPNKKQRYKSFDEFLEAIALEDQMLKQIESDLKDLDCRLMALGS